jgi:hypothetical protein
VDECGVGLVAGNGEKMAAKMGTGREWAEEWVEEEAWRRACVDGWCGLAHSLR